MEGVVRIDKVVQLLEVWLDGACFPVPMMKVKVLDRSTDFLAVANLRLLHPKSRQPEGTAGLGETADKAFEDLIENLVAMVREYYPDGQMTENDIEWIDPADF